MLNLPLLFLGTEDPEVMREEKTDLWSQDRRLKRGATNPTSERHMPPTVWVNGLVPSL